MRTETVAIEPVKLESISESGNPDIALEVKAQLGAVPHGPWQLMAITDSPAELPAQTIDLDVETLVVTASFANWFPFPVTLTEVAVDVEEE